jgi:hypothetical protein
VDYAGISAAHASAIAEAWLAVLERGPAAGLSGTGWLPDRAGWQAWRRGGADVTLSRTRSCPPTCPGRPGQRTDRAPAGETVAFIEIDLATMSQSKLREKVRRYLAYAEDLEWDGWWPHCPPLLLLITTQAQAVTFLRVAARVAAAARRGPRGRRLPPDHRRAGSRWASSGRGSAVCGNPACRAASVILGHGMFSQAVGVVRSRRERIPTLAPLISAWGCGPG